MKRVVKPDPLAKRVPKSSKYDHIQGRLDTGMTAPKMKVVSVREFSRRREEIYYRVQREQMELLYEEYDSRENDESMGHMSTSGGIASLGMGNRGPTIVTHTDEDKAVYDRPYLLVDVRDISAFQDGHLLQARSFPSHMLRRDAHHPEIFQFRNKPEHMIIVYCDTEGEVQSRECAKIMTDRGADNVFLLTGGFKEMVHKYPHRIEGNMPDLPVSPNRIASRKHREKRQQLEALKDGLRMDPRDRARMEGISETASYSSRANPAYKDEEAGRRPYSLSTARSPNVSDRVAKALSQQKEKHGYNVSQGRDIGSYSHRTGDSSGALNSARLREHDRREMDDHSARGSPSQRSVRGQGDYGRGDRGHCDDDGRSEGGCTARSTRSVAESVMSKAMSRRGRGY